MLLLMVLVVALVSDWLGAIVSSATKDVGISSSVLLYACHNHTTPVSGDSLARLVDLRGGAEQSLKGKFCPLHF